MKKVYFIQRLFAYMIDILLISLVSTLLISFIPVSDSYKLAAERLEKEYVDLIQNTDTNDIMKKVNEIQEDAYIVGKNQSLLQLIEVVLYVIYFGVIQFYLGGKSLGKKISKIKILGLDGKEISQNKMLVRTVLNYTLYISVIEVMIYYLAPSSICLYVLFPFSLISSIYNITNVLMMMFKKDGRGLTDIICKTKVISF